MRAEDFRFGLQPVVEVAAILPAALLIQLIRPYRYLPLDELDQESANVF